MSGVGRLGPCLLALSSALVGCGPAGDWIHPGGGHGHGGGSTSSSSTSSGSSSGGGGSSSGSSSSGGGGIDGGSSSSSSGGGSSSDRVAPVTTASVSDGWYAGSVDVVLTCVDEESGCAGTRYTIYDEGEALWGSSADYAGPIHLTRPSYLSFRSVDAAGNQESPRAVTVDVLPEGVSPHLRIGKGEFSVTTQGRGFSGPGRLRLVERSYISAAYWSGLAAQYSMADGVESVVTVGGSPLKAFYDPSLYEESGLPVAFDAGGSNSYWVQLFVAPGSGAEAFPLRISTPGPMTGLPPAPITLEAATLDVPDAPLLLDVERTEENVFRFTGSLLRGSAGRFRWLVLEGRDEGRDPVIECEVPVSGYDEAQVKAVLGADPWSDVVEFTPSLGVASCMSPPYALSSIRLEWDPMATDWFEATPEPSPFGRSPDWGVTVHFERPW